MLELVLAPASNDTVSLFASVNGQLASKDLDSSEKMVLGGMYAVRAYPEGEAYADARRCRGPWSVAQRTQDALPHHWRSWLAAKQEMSYRPRCRLPDKTEAHSFLECSVRRLRWRVFRQRPRGGNHEQ